MTELYILPREPINKPDKTGVKLFVVAAFSFNDYAFSVCVVALVQVLSLFMFVCPAFFQSSQTNDRTSEQTRL